MSRDLNRALLIGNLGADPEVRTTSSGRRVATFSVATNRRESRGERTDWHRVVAWDELVDVAGRGLRRGETVFVEGWLEYRSWKDRSGRDRFITEIIAQELIPLGPPTGGAGGQDADVPTARRP